MSIAIELAILYNKQSILSIWLEKCSKITKYFLVVCENVRDPNFSIQQQSNILANILYPYHFLYKLYEKYQSNEIFGPLLATYIQDLVFFMFFLTDKINQKTNGFNHFNEFKAISFANLQVSSQIPLSNMFTFEIFTNFLVDQKNQRLFTVSLYEESKVILIYY